MKVLMVENGGGGYSTYTRDLCTALTRVRGTVTLLTTPEMAFQAGGSTYQVIDQLLPRHPRKAGRLRFYGHTLVGALLNMRQIARMADALQPDVIHLQVAVPVVYGAKLPRLTRHHTVIMTVHDVLPHRREGRLNRSAYLRRLYERCHHLIVHSQANRQTLIELFSLPEYKVSVIPHGLNIPAPGLERQEARRRLGLPGNGKILLFLGTLRANKGLMQLLEAFTALAVADPQSHLLIAGNPAGMRRADELQHALQAHPARERIHARLGWLTNEEMGHCLDAADICVLPYLLFDSQSGILMQACARGKPVVVTDVGSLKETVLGDDIGLVCQPNSTSDLADTLLTLPGVSLCS